MNIEQLDALRKAWLNAEQSARMVIDELINTTYGVRSTELEREARRLTEIRTNTQKAYLEAAVKFEGLLPSTLEVVLN